MLFLFLCSTFFRKSIDLHNNCAYSSKSQFEQVTLTCEKLSLKKLLTYKQQTFIILRVANKDALNN